MLHKSVTHLVSEPMPKETKLVKRGNIYYLRKRIPVELVGYMLGPSGYPRREVWKSLKVSSYIEATRRLPKALANLEEEFLDIRNTKQTSVVQFENLIDDDKSVSSSVLSLLQKLLFDESRLVSSSEEEGSVKLKKLTEGFLRDKASSGKRASTMLAYRQSCEVMEGFFGVEKVISEISLDDIRDLCEFIEQVPVNAKQRFPKLSITEAVIKANAQGCVRRISSRSQSLLFDKINSIMSYAVSIGWLNKNNAAHPIFKNRFKFITPKKALFNDEDLTSLFNGEWYRYTSLENRKSSFWIPLLGLFHGCRLNEICQLRLDNIGCDQGVPYFSIRESKGIELKTSASNRDVPIHDELLKIGFLEYVDSIRSLTPKDGRIFPELKLASDNTFSSLFSKRFTRYRDQTLGTKSKASFHSFRHMFRDSLRRARVDIERVNALGGWAGSGGMQARYGDGFLIEDLNKDLQKVEYKNLNLAHLYI